ncbi:hypothetical protein OEV98_03690 [Caldibacillus lycopersici]|uniref:Uncharacterized protein n=1 Tax=Perspicuibacillus lycopersici TaxID=1325689 RepID=A0AAE3ISL5_9BACI|nr:hypothetical protein [Perspicuibacillus lycopersici]MCU9612666.1 hypothetical protein [Perspicuibacillus lycopersici]
MIRSLSLAFSQVAQLQEVRKSMSINTKLAGKNAESLDVILRKTIYRYQRNGMQKLLIPL